MTIDEARALVAAAIEQRNKWGKHFGNKDLHPEFLDALVELDETEGAEVAVMREALAEERTLANRQLGAAKARETRMKNQIAALKAELAAFMNAAANTTGA